MTTERSNPTIIRGKVDKAATKVALWLQAEKVHDWLAAQAAFCGQPLLTPAQQLNLRRDGMRIATEQAWNSSGIYVYSYGHYLTHPYHPESGRTLLKIGYADRATGGVRARVHEQGNTAIPEDPVLLRVYRPDDEIRSSELRLATPCPT